MKKLLILLLCFSYLTVAKHSGFIYNSGIWDSEVLFVSFDNNETVWVTKSGFIFQNYNKNSKTDNFLKNENTINYNEIAIEYEFLECKFNDVEESGIYNSNYNFIIGNDENKWINNCIPTKELVFNNVKGNSKVKYYFENGRFRYDIINYKDIEIAINGADNIKIEEDKLLIYNNNNYLIQKDLKGIVDSKEKPVNIKLNRNIISFQTENDYISGLIIDPLIYGSYIGGLGYDSGEDLKIDGDGNIVIVGETTSLNFPATLGSFSRELNTKDTTLKPDVFVTKLDENNNHIFTTYIGSTASDYGRGVSLDTNNHIYVTGYSSFTEDFPIFGDTYMQTHNGAFDGFVLKLKQSGDILLQSTFIGGIRDDFPLSIEAMSDGKCVITGYTTEAPDSARFPATSGVFNSVYSGNIDCFITVLNNNFETLIWSGIIGGLKDDFPQEIKIDKDNDIYICGLTRSPNYPTTPGVIKRQYTDNENSASNSDGFVSKISSDGQQIIFSTLLGGRNADIAYSLAVDNEKNVYVGGSTSSEDFILSSNAFSKILNNGKSGTAAVDAFVMKIDSSAQNLFYSSYLGGESNDRCYGIDIDRFGSLYGTGLTNSIDYPTSYLTYDDTFNDSLVYSDMIMFKVNPIGDSLVYSSFYGGERSDLGKSIAVKFENTALITGNTSSTINPTTEDAIQFEYQDSLKSDAFVIEVFMEDLTNSDYVICKGLSVMLDSDISSTTTSLSFSWSPEESLDDPTKEFPIATPDRSTQYQCVVTDQNNGKYIALVLVSVIPGINTQINGEKECDNGVEYIYSTPNNPGSKFKWLAINGDILGSDSSSSIKVIWTDAENGVLRVIENSEYGCNDTVWKEINYRSSYQLLIIPFGDYILCEGDTVVLDGGNQYTNYQWNSGSRTRYDTVYTSGIHFFTAKDQNGNNYTSPQATITLKPKPSTPNVIYNQPNKEFLCLNTASAYQWYFQNIKIQGATNRRYTPNQKGCYKVEITSNNGCKNFSELVCVSDIGSVESANYSIYPNPVENSFYIKSFNLINHIEIIDLLGNILLNREIYKMEAEIDVTHFSKGVYILRINGNSSYKLVKI